MPLPTIPSGNVFSSLPTGYTVANSCRFSGSDDRLVRDATGTSTESNNKWTFSCWVKRGKLGAEQMLVDHRSSGSAQFNIRFMSDDSLQAYDVVGGSVLMQKDTTAKYRDPSAWMHILWASDRSISSPTTKLWVNGTEVTSWATDNEYSQDDTGTANSDAPTWIGEENSSGSNFEGYLAEMVWLDGTFVSGATDFGEFDTDGSPTIWKPKDVSGLTFGTNGWYLDFKASANLGNDANGGTDFGETGIAAVDQCKDSPTNSFCTMNPLNNYYPGGTLSEGNTNVVTGSSSYTFLTGTIGVSTGKWYYEAKIIDEGTHANVGIATKPPYTTNIYPGFEPNDYFYKSTDGNSYTSDAGSSYGNTYTTNDIIGVYIDLDNSKLYFAKNGTVQNSGTGISITTPAAASIDFSSESGQPGSGFYFPAVGDYSGSDTSTFALNFGNGQFAGTAVSSGNADANGYGNFEYDPSSGTFDSASKNFLAICTKNLAEHG